jgi:uncharacterized membrane protein YhaH (DUF805 family)
MQPVFRMLFSSAGRIDRKTFWTMIFCLSIVTATLRFLVVGIKDSPLVIVFLPVSIGAAVAAINNYIKRLHDLGRSGWWVLAALAVLVAGGVTASVASEGNALIVDIVVYVLLIGAIIWLGATPGQAQENRFGPPPRAGQVIQSAA